MIDFYLLRNAIKDLTRPRKLVAALLLILTPGLIALILRLTHAHRFDDSQLYNFFAEYVVFGFVMVILAVVFCTSVVTQEVEDKTIVYLLTRPIARWRILTVKFLPALFVTMVTVWLALILLALVTLGPSKLSGTSLLRDLEMTPVGVLAYGTLFLLMATLLDRPLIYGLLYAFGWEAWVPNLPGSFQKLSLMVYMRIIAPHAIPQPETMEVTQALTTLTQETVSSTFAWTVLTCLIIIGFIASLVAFSKREYVPRDAE